MPDARTHLKRAAENERLAAELATTDGVRADWAITVLFYSGLHYIDAYLAVKCCHPRDHGTRDSEIANNGSLADIYRDYRKLKDWSRSARYDVREYTQHDFTKAQNTLATIRQHIDRKLRL